MAVLKGDSEAVGGKKVLKSTTKDRVFLNFADHGAPGLIAFPAGGYLYATDLHKTFDYMYENGLYGELVFYLEACESGSMFVDLKTDTKIFGTSAANPTESSWGYYCSPDDKVNGKHVGSCLGDLYSINWMEDTDKGNLEETLQ
jgi:legumain